MPKAKPLSLNPLKFKEALEILLKAGKPPAKSSAKKKPKRSKPSSSA